MPRSRPRFGIGVALCQHMPALMGRPRVRHRQVLLLVDVINDMVFPGSSSLVAQAVPMARKLAKLKARAKARGVPCVYCNDNFGRWRSDFRSLVAHCVRDNVPGRPVASLLQPDDDDYFILKPRHSAFFATPLELLLRDLEADTLVITGIAANICVLFSANDAYIRGYRVVVPPDCVASNTRSDTRRAIAQMETVLRAEVRQSSAIRFERRK
jgi:nicotinamidase-related amidase